MDVTCAHLVDGTIVLFRIKDRSYGHIIAEDPLILTKYFDKTAEVKLMLARYDNFGISDGTVEFKDAGIISTYTVDDKTAAFYDRYVNQYNMIEQNPDIDPSTLDWPEDIDGAPTPKENAETMTSMVKDMKTVDIDELRKSVIRLVKSDNDD